MNTEETYEMYFTCTNCGNRYLVKIPKGREAEGQGGECPYCGKHDYGTFWYIKRDKEYHW